MFILFQLPTDHLVEPMLVQMNGIIGNSGVYASASLYDTNNIHSLVTTYHLNYDYDQHDVLRRFVNMLAEQYDLLRNYIDNYLNFYKLDTKSKFNA